jgi:uncharacterized integral membrane protein
MERGWPTLVDREFKVAVGVGTMVTVVVGLIFLFLGASVDDRSAPIPSFPLWLLTLLAAEASALLVAWGGLVLYFGASHDGPAGRSQLPLVLGLLAGALGGVLFVVFLLIGDAYERSSRRWRRDRARRL